VLHHGYSPPFSSANITAGTRRIENLERSLNYMRTSAPGNIASDSSNIHYDPVHAGDGFRTKEARIDRLEQTLLHYTALENQIIENDASDSSNVAAYALNPAQRLSTNSLPGRSKEEVYLDVIDRGILDLKNAHDLVQEFKTMNHNFPYVAISASLSTGTLRHDSPMLLLAICATAAWKDRELQIKLERAYLKELAARMVVNGEQTLDMLQGLLVHLSW
jgi:hypothetical protein